MITLKKKSYTLIQLSKNDINARYANSFLGIAWAYVMPLVTILVFWYVFQLGFKNPPINDAPYILWFSAAYIPWIYYVDITTTGCNCLVEYSFLVKKIKFDVEYIPLVKVISALFVHVFFIFFLFLMYLIYGMKPDLYNFQIIYYLFATTFLGLAVTWLTSAVNVFFKDLNSLYNVLVQVGFWVTPILWNEDTMVNTHIRRVLAINPMHYIINGYRDSLIYHRWFWEKPLEMIVFWSITVLLWIIGRSAFIRLKPYFADEV